MFSGCAVGYLFYAIVSYESDSYYVNTGDILLLFYLYTFLFFTMLLFVKDKEKMQEKIIKRMELFGSAIAHEVNTPIATIQIIAMTLYDIAASINKEAVKIENQDGSIDYKIILPESEYKMMFENLPYDLLKTSKEGKKVIDILLLLLKHRDNDHNASYSIREIVKEVIGDYIMEADKINRINFKHNNDFKFFGIKQYMKQILKNLLNNALKYAGDDAKITIWISGNSLHVKDNGVGIKPEYIKNLFKPFHEKDTKGSGIGLAFCGMLINNMGGIIECVSEYGKYTEFIVSLPTEK